MIKMGDSREVVRAHATTLTKSQLVELVLKVYDYAGPESELGSVLRHEIGTGRLVVTDPRNELPV